MAAALVRGLLDRHGIPKHKQSGVVEEFFHLSRSAAHRRVHGSAPWNVEELQRLAGHYGETLVELFGGASKPDGEPAVRPRTTTIRILIADDHPLIIEGLTLVLVRFDVEVVATATSTDEVVAAYLATAPDVVVLDVRFGGKISGLDVARSVLAEAPDARILFYSQFDQEELLREAYRLGARGFVTKSTAPAVVADAIRQVHAGKTFFLPEIAERLALAGVHGDDSPSRKLDARELAVFLRMAAGETNSEIAQALGVSGTAIDKTTQAIKEKLGVSRPADITLLAVRHQLIQP